MSSKKRKPTKKAVAKSRGTRYSNEQKKEVVDFVHAYNKAKGRGGQSAAARKFGITVLTISTWLRGSGGLSAGSAKSAKVSGGVTKKVEALLSLGQQIRKAEGELEKLRGQFDALAASIRSEI